MRKILFLSLVSFTMSLTTQAQTAPPKKEPAKEAPKAEAEEKVEDTIDLDAFFKKGEENAKKGSSCEKPADPIA